MSYRLIFSDRAEADLEEITAHIAKDSPRAASRVLISIRTKCAAVAQLPTAYAIREDIAPAFRRANQHPYAILFSIVDDNTVHIERILHSARDLPSLFDPED
jgi:toxin ParE1/3/4